MLAIFLCFAFCLQNGAFRMVNWWFFYDFHHCPSECISLSSFIHNFTFRIAFLHFWLDNVLAQLYKNIVTKEIKPWNTISQTMTPQNSNKTLTSSWHKRKKEKKALCKYTEIACIKIAHSHFFLFVWCKSPKYPWLLHPCAQFVPTCKQNTR